MPSLNSKRSGQSPRPAKSKGLLNDVWNFIVRQPKVKTLLRFREARDRDNHNKRIMQRLGITPDGYSILNIHQIGVDAPPIYVFNEIMDWSGDSPCWPNHIAKTEQVNSCFDNIRILPFGWTRYPFGWKSLLGINLIPLFNMNIIRAKVLPDPYDFDNARYRLYECTGGYPIGFFSIYVRSSIPDSGETEGSQLFIVVGFDFYGRKDLSKLKLVRWMWEFIHNRVTANVIHRLKWMCEWSFEDLHNQADLLRHFD